jgi:alpha-N-arabinofuranosidase
LVYLSQHSLGLIVAIQFTTAWGLVAWAAPVLQIDTNRVVARVSPEFAGLMSEEINHSFDGGLYAELIRDRAMTSTLQLKSGALGAWTLIDGASPAGLALDVIAIRNSWP